MASELPDCCNAIVLLYFGSALDFYEHCVCDDFTFFQFEKLWFVQTHLRSALCACLSSCQEIVPESSTISQTEEEEEEEEQAKGSECVSFLSLVQVILHGAYRLL